MASRSPASRSSLAALTLGAIGIVYGDIGTSPLYAFREALAQTAGDGIDRGEILGVLSLALWALIVVVTLKYVLFLMRADNNGEGGVLSLMALAGKATANTWPIVLLLGGIGASLFYGDAIITPALSVLSAVEGLRTISGLEGVMSEPLIISLTVGILISLFSIQAQGTARVAGLFGPICSLWFISIGALGLRHIAQAPEILLAFDPLFAVRFLLSHGVPGLFVLGAVFLTVTGAEALIADMGHFGRKPIQLGWLGFVWPSLTLNYLGQGALALQALWAAQAHGQAFGNADWFFLMAPDMLRAPLVLLATAATIIASQAVITGAFSLTQQAIALGLLPRLTIRQTSADHMGQIYMPLVNWLLLVGVLVLVFAFRTSTAMAAAYGIAVTGTMVVTTCLAFIVAWRGWRWHPLWTALLFLPFLAIDLVFFGANILRVSEGGWVPLLVAGMMGLVIVAWMRGRRAVLQRTSEQGVAMGDFAHAIAERPPAMVQGVAVFLTPTPDVAPSALLHNLKHNKALHATNILLSVVTAPRPYIATRDRLRSERIDEHFVRVKLRYGYMERIDVPSDLARSEWLKGAGGTSFFVGRIAIRKATHPAVPRWIALLYGFLHRNSADPTSFFAIPANRVVELGTQVEL